MVIATNNDFSYRIDKYAFSQFLTSQITCVP